jgi:hypothetical protein
MTGLLGLPILAEFLKLEVLILDVVLRNRLCSPSFLYTRSHSKDLLTIAVLLVLCIQQTRSDSEKLTKIFFLEKQGSGKGPQKILF